MDCKYHLPCGICELKNIPCTFAYVNTRSMLKEFREDSNIGCVTAEDYRLAIEFMKHNKAIYSSESQRYFDMAIDALLRERDQMFPGKWTKGGK